MIAPWAPGAQLVDSRHNPSPTTPTFGKASIHRGCRRSALARPRFARKAIASARLESPRVARPRTPGASGVICNVLPFTDCSSCSSSRVVARAQRARHELREAASPITSPVVHRTCRSPVRFAAAVPPDPALVGPARAGARRRPDVQGVRRCHPPRADACAHRRRARPGIRARRPWLDRAQISQRIREYLVALRRVRRGRTACAILV